MSRNISLTAKQAIYAQQTDKIFLTLLTITHADLPAPLRFVNDMQDIVSRGNTYIAFPFMIDLPTDKDDNLSTVTLIIDNVDRQIVQAVRTLTSAPAVTMEIVIASSPDTVEAGPFDFRLKNATYDVQTISGTLGYEEDILNEPFPAGSFNPTNFPGMFIGGSRIEKKVYVGED